MKLLMENWREYLEGVETHPDIATSQEDIQTSLDYFYKEHAPEIGKRSDAGELFGHNAVRYDLDGGDVFYFLVDKDDIAKAYIALEPFKESYIVGNVRKTKGGGFYATDLYKWLVDQFGSIYSDYTQTTKAQGLWDRLQQDPEVNVEWLEDEKRWRMAK